MFNKLIECSFPKVIVLTNLFLIFKGFRCDFRPDLHVILIPIISHLAHLKFREVSLSVYKYYNVLRQKSSNSYNM